MLAVLGIIATLALFDWQRTRQRARARAEEVAPQAREILERNCFECHGRDPDNVKKNLNVLNHALLLDSARRLVVPGAPQESRLLQRMPPEEEESRLPRLAEREVDILTDWIQGGAPPLPPPDPDAPTPPVVPYSALAAQVKDIFEKRCYECHDSASKKGGIKILHHRLLVNVRRVVIPYRPDNSELYQLLITSDNDLRMSRPPKARLPAAEIATIRQWIEEGAAPFPRAE